MAFRPDPETPIPVRFTLDADPRRNSIRSALTASGCSCCTQCPAPSSKWRRAVRFRCRRRPTTNFTRPRTRSSNPVPSRRESCELSVPERRGPFPGRPDFSRKRCRSSLLARAGASAEVPRPAIRGLRPEGPITEPRATWALDPHLALPRMLYEEEKSARGVGRYLDKLVRAPRI